MKKISLPLIAAGLLLVSFAFTSNMTWKAGDSEGAVTFKGGKVEGSFTGLKATVDLDATQLDRATIKASIDATSINTGNAMMQEHALSEEALNGEKFKTIDFNSSNITLVDGQYIAAGDLTMKGVSKKVSIPFIFENTEKSGMLTGTFTVVPSEFGLTRGGVPKEVTITLNIPFSN